MYLYFSTISLYYINATQNEMAWWADASYMSNELSDKLCYDLHPLTHFMWEMLANSSNLVWCSQANVS